MRCPSCNVPLATIRYAGERIDRCPRCDGLWFDADEFRRVKDASYEFLRWLDIDPWENEAEFRLRRGLIKQCPKDGVPLYEVDYGDAAIVVDVCNVCGGMWLDEGEFRAILDYLRARIDQESIAGYLKSFLEEGTEMVSGSEGFVSEARDFLLVQRLLAYKLFAKMPFLASFIEQLP